MKRRLVAAVAVRNAGSRLFGKPMQNLDVNEGLTILDNIIGTLRSLGCIDEVILGISEGSENQVFVEYADRLGLRYVVGDQEDVLGRLIACGQLGEATDIFRITSESPFLYFEPVEEAWQRHQDEDADAVFLDDIVDGCGFEILSMKALERSHAEGEDRHRSELCSVYIRENNTKFRTIKLTGPEDLDRRDLRLTVDNPEDLVICRHIFKNFKSLAPRIPVADIVAFLDQNPELIALTAPFTEIGYETMFVWGKGDDT